MMNEAFLPCILLAAGASARMGENKLLLPLGGETVVRRAARAALEACRPVIVVVGKDSERILDALAGLDGLIFAENPLWREGMAGSVKAGIGALPPGTAGFLVHHADMPFAGIEAFLPVIRAARRDPARRETPREARAWRGIPREGRARRGGIPREAYSGAYAEGSPFTRPVMAAYRGTAGHPVYFPASSIPDILALPNGAPLKGIAMNGGILAETRCEAVLEDMDNPADYDRLRKKYDS